MQIMNYVECRIEFFQLTKEFLMSSNNGLKCRKPVFMRAFCKHKERDTYEKVNRKRITKR